MQEKAVPVQPVEAKLSTDVSQDVDIVVDDCQTGWRLGMVLPKKQAKRSVTRSLIRHQVRESLRRHGADALALPAYAGGVDGWVVRLKTPFDRQLFPSAASSALGVAVRAELDQLWSQLQRRTSSKPQLAKPVRDQA